MPTIQTEIISIGNELLSGITTNTNASFIADQLTQNGFEISWITTISDTPLEIAKALSYAGNRARIVIVTGGLGPTPDDLTKKAIANFFKTELVLHDKTLNRIKKMFQDRGLRMPDINIDQAMVPACAKILTNNFGTAPGLEVETDDSIYFFLPGVPHEMKILIQETVLNRIITKYKPQTGDRHTFRTNGLAESKLFEKVGPIINDWRDQYSIAFLPKTSGVDLRIKSVPSKGIDPEFLKGIRYNLAEYIYTEEDESLPEVIGRLLVAKNFTLAVGESFTGGTISDWISNIPGCSRYFTGSVIAYSNKIKTDLLDVPQKTLDKYGAVSYETVEKMVQGVQKRFRTDCAIASTGIAGPDGATPDKALGLSYLAALLHDRVLIKKFNFGRERRINKERGAAAGLELLRRLLIE